jgi:hypothetical protein
MKQVLLTEEKFIELIFKAYSEGYKNNDNPNVKVIITDMKKYALELLSSAYTKVKDDEGYSYLIPYVLLNDFHSDLKNAIKDKTSNNYFIKYEQYKI